MDFSEARISESSEQLIILVWLLSGLYSIKWAIIFAAWSRCNLLWEVFFDWSSYNPENLRMVSLEANVWDKAISYSRISLPLNSEGFSIDSSSTAPLWWLPYTLVDDIAITLLMFRFDNKFKIFCVAILKPSL